MTQVRYMAGAQITDNANFFFFVCMNTCKYSRIQVEAGGKQGRHANTVDREGSVSGSQNHEKINLIRNTGNVNYDSPSSV